MLLDLKESEILHFYETTQMITILTVRNLIDKNIYSHPFSNPAVFDNLTREFSIPSSDNENEENKIQEVRGNYHTSSYLPETIFSRSFGILQELRR